MVVNKKITQKYDNGNSMLSYELLTEPARMLIFDVMILKNNTIDWPFFICFLLFRVELENPIESGSLFPQ